MLVYYNIRKIEKAKVYVVYYDMGRAVGAGEMAPSEQKIKTKSRK